MNDKNLPLGWGDNDADDELEGNPFGNYDEEENSDSPWNTNPNEHESSEKTTSSETSLESNKTDDNESITSIDNVSGHINSLLVEKNTNSKVDDAVKTEHESDDNCTRSHEKNEKNSGKSRLFIGIIVFIILVICVLGIIFFLKGKNINLAKYNIFHSVIDDSGNSSESTDDVIIENSFESSYDVITENSSESSYDVITVTTTVKTSATQSSTEIITTTVTDIPVSNTSVEILSPDIIKDYPQYLTCLEEAKSDTLYNCTGYFLCDLNGDNVPELFVTDDYDEICYIYTIYNGTVKNLMQAGAATKGIILYKNGYIGMLSGGAAYRDTCFMQYTGGDDFDDGESLHYEYDKSRKNYSITHNYGDTEKQITEAEEKAIIDKYLPLEVNPAPISDAISAESETKASTNVDKSAMYKDANPIAYGHVITNDDPLNMRAKPSTDSDILAKMPPGTLIKIYEVLTGWYYVSYSENGNTYYGYASSQFIEENYCGQGEN